MVKIPIKIYPEQKKYLYEWGARTGQLSEAAADYWRNYRSELDRSRFPGAYIENSQNPEEPKK